MCTANAKLKAHINQLGMGRPPRSESANCCATAAAASDEKTDDGRSVSAAAVPSDLLLAVINQKCFVNSSRDPDAILKRYYNKTYRTHTVVYRDVPAVPGETDFGSCSTVSIENYTVAIIILLLITAPKHKIVIYL